LIVLGAGDDAQPMVQMAALRGMERAGRRWARADGKRPESVS
jgi:hypothetical protein